MDATEFLKILAGVGVGLIVGCVILLVIITVFERWL